MSEIWSFGADELARRIRQRQLSSKEERRDKRGDHGGQRSPSD